MQVRAALVPVWPQGGSCALATHGGRRALASEEWSERTRLCALR